MKTVFVVGMGLSARDMTGQQLEIIRSADILMGGRRHLEQFKDLQVKKERITAKVDETINFIKSHRDENRIVVLASGDPLFFGIGVRIAAELGSNELTMLPNITTVAAAFARINEPWSDAIIVSLHGRDRRYHLLNALKSNRAVAVLTDARQSPQWLARWLMEKGAGHVKMAVFERLGMPEEAYGWYAPDRAADQSFTEPNVVILKPLPETTDGGDLVLGMADEDFQHESGLITKLEVRAVTLAKLHLKAGLTLWDLGAGSGSVGIEASVLIGHGRIVAVEQQAHRVSHIRENAHQYGVYNLDAVQAKLPESVDTLPAPDRIFIGGGGQDLPSIIKASAGRLASGGIMVVNTVLVDNLTQALEAMEAGGMITEAVQMQVSKSKAMPWSRRMEAQNPVWIISGRKERGKK
jgi:precorrin-6Y C5,15-methyltransferase (decarboxylating)